MPVNEMPGYHFPQNQIGAVVSTHSSGSSPLAREDRIHSIQQLSVMWEKNQCVREKLLRSPSRRCHLNQRRCGAAGRAPSPVISGNICIAADGVYCADYDNTRDSRFRRVIVVEYKNIYISIFVILKIAENCPWICLMKKKIINVFSQYIFMIEI